MLLLICYIICFVKTINKTKIIHKLLLKYKYAINNILASYYYIKEKI